MSIITYSPNYFFSYYFEHGFYEGAYDARYSVAVQMFDTQLMYEEAGDVINEQQEIMTSSTELDEIQVNAADKTVALYSCAKDHQCHVVFSYTRDRHRHHV